MESGIKETFREYAWRYFALHADQRIKTFNFFIIVAGTLAGGIVTLLKDARDGRSISLLGLLLTILAFIFWKLDQRNRELIEQAKAAIKHLDSKEEALSDEEGRPHVLKLFAVDENVKKHRESSPLLYRQFSYSQCFGLVFWFFGVLGLIFAILSFVTKDPQRPKSDNHSTSAAMSEPISDFQNDSIAVRKIDCEDRLSRIKWTVKRPGFQ